MRREEDNGKGRRRLEFQWQRPHVIFDTLLQQQTSAECHFEGWSTKQPRKHLLGQIRKQVCDDPLVFLFHGGDAYAAAFNNNPPDPTSQRLVVIPPSWKLARLRGQICEKQGQVQVTVLIPLVIEKPYAVYVVTYINV